MKKQLMMATAAAVAMLANGAQAQSSVQLMGLVDVWGGSVRMSKDDRVYSLGAGGMTTSWFGVKGSEDLGGGLKANFALTAFIRPDMGLPGRFNGDPFFSRDANVSLSGPWGAVSLGRDIAPNFLPTIIFNPFGDSFTFSPLVLHNNISLFNGTNWSATTPSDTGWSNQIRYTTPNFGGLSANLHYQLGEQPNSTGVKNVGFNVLYFAGPFAATAFYERDNLSNPVPAPFAGGETKKDWMLGASYDFKAVKVYGTVGKATSSTSSTDRSTYTLGASMPMGPGSLLAGYANTKVDPGPTRKTSTIGYDYFLSKRTDVYAMFMYDKITTFSGGTSFGAGIRTRF